MEKHLKCYISLPFRKPWGKNDWKTHIPLGGGLFISWKDYDFDLCDSPEYLPKGRKKGKHKCTIGLGLFYWSASLVFYISES